MNDCAHLRLTRDIDPDSYYCIDCFNTIQEGGEPLPFVAPGRIARSEAARKVSHMAKAMIPTLCMDCGTEITARSLRCGPCARSVNKLTLGPGPKRPPVSVTAPAPRR